MSYRFNKDTRNSKNSSFNKRSSNYYRQDNDSKKSNFNDRRRTNNKINRLSSDQVNQYSLDKESSLNDQEVVTSQIQTTEDLIDLKKIDKLFIQKSGK